MEHFVKQYEKGEYSPLGFPPPESPLHCSSTFSPVVVSIAEESSTTYFTTKVSLFAGSLCACYCMHTTCYVYTKDEFKTL